MNSITKSSCVELTNFKNINSKNGKYFGNTVFGSKNVTKKLKMRASLLISKKIKQQWDNVLKNIHNFRITNLKNIQNKECGMINDKLKNIKVIDNNNLKFDVANNVELNNDLQELLKDYTDEKINEAIQNVFTEETKLARIEDKDLIIDKNKLKKIAEDDFTIAIKKIIAKVEDPKAIKYLYNFINNLDKNKVSDKVTNEIKKSLANQTKIIITDLLATESIDNQKKIEDFHALLTICNSYDIDISNNKRNKILDSCLHSFDVIATNLNDTSYDINVLKQQYNDLYKLKEKIIHPIIINTVHDPDKKIIKINEKLLFVKKWTNLTINKHNSLIKELENNRIQAVNNSDNIAKLINKRNELWLKYSELNDKLAEKGLSKKIIKALDATKKEIYAKYQQSSLQLDNTWKQLSDLLNNNQTKQIELEQYINTYKNIPKNELLKKAQDYTDLINNDLQQQIDAKKDNFSENEKFTQLVNNALVILEAKYNKTISLTLIKSVLENITKNDNFVTCFTEKISFYEKINSENNNDTEHTTSIYANETTEDHMYMNIDTMNTRDTFAVPPEAELQPAASLQPPIAPVTQNRVVSNDKLQAPNRQNLLNDIRNPGQINRLKKVSRNNTSENNKVGDYSANNNSLEKSLAFKKTETSGNENISNNNNAANDSEWD